MSKSALKTLVLATHNAGKIQELGVSLANCGWKVVGIGDFRLEAPEESGATFEANAAIKAEAASQTTGFWALADDSGLEVDALDGAPGVTTADFGGWSKLLQVMAHVPEGKRSARFVCVLALSRVSFPTLYYKGVCEGVITLQARGGAGFGYDPVFCPLGSTMTFAEMKADEKAVLSHRGIALRLLLEWMATNCPENSRG